MPTQIYHAITADEHVLDAPSDLNIMVFFFLQHCYFFKDNGNLNKLTAGLVLIFK